MVQIFNSKLVHVVTHSGIMNYYLKTLDIHVKKIQQNESDNISFIGKSNCWTFVTNAMIKCSKKINGKTKIEIIENLNNEPKTENITENINLINSLEIGVKENPDAKEIEQIFKKGKLSLCGQIGSIKKKVRKMPLKMFEGYGRRSKKNEENDEIKLVMYNQKK